MQHRSFLRNRRHLIGKGEGASELGWITLLFAWLTSWSGCQGTASSQVTFLTMSAQYTSHTANMNKIKLNMNPYLNTCNKIKCFNKICHPLPTHTYPKREGMKERETARRWLYHMPERTGKFVFKGQHRYGTSYITRQFVPENLSKINECTFIR